jgi:hypothetical protein
MKKINTALFAFFLMLAFALACLNSCKKETNSTELSSSEFIEKTQALIKEKKYHGLADEIDFSTTKTFRHEQGIVFHTQLKPSVHFARALVSIVRPDRKVLQYIIVVDKTTDNESRNTLYTLGGTKFGFYRTIGEKIDTSPEDKYVTFDDGTPGRGEDDGIPDHYDPEYLSVEEIDEPIYQINSWWSCTKDCIGDAHIACYMDNHCQTMLLISNFTPGSIAMTKVAGLGSASIGISCGVACALNTHMDLLPQF